MIKSCLPGGMWCIAMLAGAATLPCGKIASACSHSVWESILVNFMHPLLHQVRPLFCKSTTCSADQPPTWTAHQGYQTGYKRFNTLPGIAPQMALYSHYCTALVLYLSSACLRDPFCVQAIVVCTLGVSTRQEGWCYIYWQSKFGSPYAVLPVVGTATYGTPIMAGTYWNHI